MKRRRATWGNGGVSKTRTKSAAQVVPIFEELHITRRNEAAYRANPLLHWPEEETYNRAVETGNWSEYNARYGFEEEDDE